jgi:uracil-DNA glycosylase
MKIERDPAELGIGKWAELSFFNNCSWATLATKLEKEVKWHPSKDKIFQALALTQPDNVKVVILGMDPFPDEKLATGLAFSIPSETKVPPGNCLKVVEDKLFQNTGAKLKNGDLTHWATRFHLKIPIPRNFNPATIVRRF